ncbi:MAG: thioredoxin domain-containing protein [Candidatus Omnitrophica bacterium]|nr:thioredoxin domain-containing protein [Candidatus Omnitrophota bacterium]
MAATKFAVCAGQQGKFWPFMHLILKRQQTWSELTDPQPAFLEAVKDIQLNPQSVLACTNDDALRVKVLEEKDAGAALGIKSTPTYFINGKMVVGVASMLDEVYRLLGIPKPVEPAPFQK